MSDHDYRTGECAALKEVAQMLGISPSTYANIRKHIEKLEKECTHHVVALKMKDLTERALLERLARLEIDHRKEAAEKTELLGFVDSLQDEIDNRDAEIERLRAEVDRLTKLVPVIETRIMEFPGFDEESSDE